jgi:hypothetical protein
LLLNYGLNAIDWFLGKICILDGLRKKFVLGVPMLALGTLKLKFRIIYLVLPCLHFCGGVFEGSGLPVIARVLQDEPFDNFILVWTSLNHRAISFHVFLLNNHDYSFWTIG